MRNPLHYFERPKPVAPDSEIVDDHAVTARGQSTRVECGKYFDYNMRIIIENTIYVN